MDRIVILVIIVLFYLGRLMFSFNTYKVNTKHFFLSFFVVTVPFEFLKSIGSSNLKVSSGTISPVISICIPVIGLIVFFLLFIRIDKSFFNLKFEKWIIVILVSIFISIINPFNVLSSATVAFAVFFLSHIIMFNFMSRYLTKLEVIKGLFEGFCILSCIHLVLAICFPVLGMVNVTNLFRSGGEEWATRLGTRNGAIGLFGHPGNLALFCIIVFSFFYSCYLNNYRKAGSLIMIIINITVLLLTYSRTSYIGFVVVFFLLYYINNNAKKAIFTFNNIIKFILPLLSTLVWLIYFSPFSKDFLKSDGTEQLENRMVHYFMSFEVFSKSPIMGVGINSHLAYLSKNYLIGAGLTMDDFFTRNPIHNIHLIVLCETGIVGFALWLFFIISSILKAKKSIANGNNSILSLTSIGLISAFFIYGMTGWAPFSASILPFFLLINFFTIRYRTTINKIIK